MMGYFLVRTLTLSSPNSYRRPQLTAAHPLKGTSREHEPASRSRCLVVVLPDGSERRSLIDYLLPSAILMLAALLLMTSIFLPYWSMTMTAPRLPQRADAWTCTSTTWKGICARSTS